MVGIQFFIIDEYFARICLRNLIDNSDEGGFSGTVWPKKTVDTGFRNIN